jgi:hypothetical protein
MDRIELDEEIAYEEAYRHVPLDLSKIGSTARFQVKTLSNPTHERNRVLAAEIGQKWGIPVPRLMKLITQKGYHFIRGDF